MKSLEQLKEAAKPIFERLGVPKLYATSDEQFFVLESRAQLHARNSKNVCYTIENKEPDAVVADAPKVLSVKDLSALVADETDLQKLSLMLLEETGGAARKTAIAAIEKRIAELTEAGTGTTTPPAGTETPEGGTGTEGAGEELSGEKQPTPPAGDERKETK